MRILVVGTYISDTRVTRTEFEASQSFLDADVVIWNPETAVTSTQLSSNRTMKGYPSLSERASVTLAESIVRRHEEMKDFLELGRSLVIFVPMPRLFYMHSVANDILRSLEEWEPSEVNPNYTHFLFNLQRIIAAT